MILPTGADFQLLPARLIQNQGPGAYTIGVQNLVIDTSGRQFEPGIYEVTVTPYFI